MLVSLGCAVVPTQEPAAGPGPGAQGCVPADPAFENALARHVREGLVDYSALAGDADFAAHVSRLATCGIEALDARQARLAFWINAYNALTLKGVLDNYPIKSVSEIGLTGRWAFFKATPFAVGGRSYTLDEIEHGIIRAGFDEPRVHFALVCASAGCPALRSEAYHPDRLEKELEEAARRFIRDPAKVRLDAERKVLHLSSIFKWYEDDFIKAGGSVVAFVGRYLETSPPAGIRIEYLDYSWALNDLRHPPVPDAPR